jgi:DNA-binding NtrC family response regulator
MTRQFEVEATVPVAERLTVRGGQLAAVSEGRTLVVGAERLRIGRAPQCELVLDHPTVSAVHAEVQATPVGVRLLDLGSRNGTFVGDARVVEAYLTTPCEIRCGNRIARFWPEAPEQIAIGNKVAFAGLVGTTPEMLTVFSTLDRFAATNLSIVITGETGTGKDRVARAIHDASGRHGKPFLAINCAAMPDALLEDELFGHARGAFTGAERERSGLLVEADGGTVFFDEVAEMSAAMQAKLLRVLENGEVRPIGSERMRRVDVRTLFATHADLAEAVNRKRFREDLYFRIAQVTVEIPPLRRRLQDLRLIVQHILEDLGHPEVTLDEAGLALLMTRSWPGNVRELRSVVSVALVGSRGGVLSFQDALGSALAADKIAPLETMTYDEAKREFRRRYYMGLYAACRGNVTQMARRAGKQRLTVREALREMSIDVDSGPGAQPISEDSTVHVGTEPPGVSPSRATK